jgi:TPR repeat protein
VNGYQQGFRSVSRFGFGGQESASKPPQAICKTLALIKNKIEMNKIILTLIVALFANSLYGQSFEEIEKSAEQGYAQAQYNLGLMYYNGEGTLTDKKQAFYWYQKSAEQGHAKAQYALGGMYYNGEGTLTDKKRAAYWIKLSYENGFEEAKKVWDELELWKY